MPFVSSPCLSVTNWYPYYVSFSAPPSLSFLPANFYSVIVIFLCCTLPPTSPSPPSPLLAMAWDRHIRHNGRAHHSAGYSTLCRILQHYEMLQTAGADGPGPASAAGQGPSGMESLVGGHSASDHPQHGSHCGIFAAAGYCSGRGATGGQRSCRARPFVPEPIHGASQDHFRCALPSTRDQAILQGCYQNSTLFTPLTLLLSCFVRLSSLSLFLHFFSFLALGQT